MEKTQNYWYKTNWECIWKPQVGVLFDAILIAVGSGYASVRITGENAKKIFEKESGAHQWHRCPPTENRGRTHTSVVKVAVLDIQPLNVINVNNNDIELSTTRGSGPGGQAKNKLETCIILKHKPTGIIVRCEAERSQYQNKILAYEILESKLRKMHEKKLQDSIDRERKDKMGCGHRAEKIRTYMVKHNLCVDHITGKKTALKEWLKGKW